MESCTATEFMTTGAMLHFDGTAPELPARRPSRAATVVPAASPPSRGQRLRPAAASHTQSQHVSATHSASVAVAVTPRPARPASICRSGEYTYLGELPPGVWSPDRHFPASCEAGGSDGAPGSPRILSAQKEVHVMLDPLQSTRAKQPPLLLSLNASPRGDTLLHSEPSSCSSVNAMKRCLTHACFA